MKQIIPLLIVIVSCSKEVPKSSVGYEIPDTVNSTMLERYSSLNQRRSCELKPSSYYLDSTFLDDIYWEE